MANIIRQTVSTLDMTLYRGNLLHLLVIWPDSFTLPQDINWVFYRKGGLIPTPQQPTLKVNGQTLEMTLDTAELPNVGLHTLFFDERAVWAGEVTVDRETTDHPKDADQNLTVMVDEVIPVYVQMVTTVIDSSGNNLNQFKYYTHDQATPDSIWLVNHDLKAYPAGIIVLDSAGSQWAFTVEYLSLNSLRLKFGSASFAGKAYIS